MRIVHILNLNIGLLTKIHNAEFVRSIYRFDIVCFTETVLELNGKLDLEQYFSPASKLTLQGRASGGIFV